MYIAIKIGIILTFLVAFVLPVQLINAQGNDGGLDAYKSGLNYGCYDAGITDSTEKYINQPGKEPAYHTEAFMIGYRNGFMACNEPKEMVLVLNI